MRIKVINGEVVLTKKNILIDIQAQMESLREGELSDTQYETLSILFRDMEFLAEVIAVEEKNGDSSYPFLGSSWEIRKKHHQ